MAKREFEVGDVVRWWPNEIETYIVVECYVGSRGDPCCLLQPNISLERALQSALCLVQKGKVALAMRKPDRKEKK